MAVTTWQAVTGSMVNCTVTPTTSPTGQFTVTAGSPGPWSFQYRIVCDGVATAGPATVSGTIVASGPNANDDTDPGVRQPNVAAPINVAGNDTPCGSGITSYVLVAGSAVNCTITGSPSPSGVFQVTPGVASCNWSFRYEIACNGVLSGEQATVTGFVDASGRGPNLIRNGVFSPFLFPALGANVPFSGPWTSSVPYSGHNTKPGDTQIAVQTGTRVYDGGVHNQIAFPGDPANGVPAASQWLFSNGNTTGAPWTIAQQTVNVVAGKTYEIVWYGSDTHAGTVTGPNPAIIQLKIGGANVGAAVTEQLHSVGDGGVDRWHRYVRTWTAPTTGPVVFAFTDNQLSQVGDDHALTAVSMREIITC